MAPNVFDQKMAQIRAGVGLNYGSSTGARPKDIFTTEPAQLAAKQRVQQGVMQEIAVVNMRQV